MRTKTFLKGAVIITTFLFLFSGADSATFNGPYNTNSQINCVGAPPASPRFNVNWDAVVGAAHYSVIQDAASPSGPYVYQGTAGNFTDLNPYEGVVYVFYASQKSPGEPGYIQGNINEWVHTPFESCNATIIVQETGASGGSWVINPESKNAVTNSVKPSSSGSSYTIGSLVPPSGFNIESVTNSDGGTYTLNIQPGQTKTFTIRYYVQPPNLPPPTVDLKGRKAGTGSFIDGPLQVNSGDRVDLQWVTTNATSCTASNNGGFSQFSGSKSGTSGSTELNVGTITVGTTFSIYCTNSAGQNSPTDSFTVTLPGGSANIEVSSNGTNYSDGPLYLSSSQNFWYRWSSVGAVSCTLGAPINSSVGTAGSAGPLGVSHPHFPSPMGTTYSISCALSGGGTAPDSVFAQRVSDPPALSATTGACNAGAISLSWTAPLGATSYKLYRDGGGTPIYTGSATTFIDAGLPAGSYHTYTVKAVNAAGDSASSSTAAGFASSECVGPTVDLTGRSAGSGSYVQGPITINPAGSVDLQWTTLGATSCSASATNGTWSGSKAVNGGQNSVGPVNSLTTYTLTCLNASGNPNFDTFVVDTSATPPPPPATVNAVTGACGGKIDVSWSASTGATSYEVSRSTTSGGTYSSIATGITSTTYTDAAGLTSGATYYYKVKAVNGAGSSANSSSIGSASASAACPVGGASVLLEGKQGTNPYVTGTVYALPAWSFVDLRWTGSNVSSCFSSGGPSPVFGSWPNPSRPVSGTVLNEDASIGSTFTITCVPTAGGANVSSNLTVIKTSGAALSVQSQDNIGFPMPSSWTIVPVSHGSPALINGSGTSASHEVFPTFVTSWSSYRITPATLAGYTFSITNTNGSGNTMTVPTGVSVKFTVIYTPAPAFDYSLSKSSPSGSPTVTKGASPVSVQATISKSLLSGSSQSVDITATGAPAGVSIAYDGNRACSPACSSTITFTVDPSASAGTYPITVTGNPGSKTVQFNLVINNPSDFTVNLVPNPSSPQVGQPVINTAFVDGASGSCVYSWSGTDITGNPSVNPYIHVYQSTGTKTIIVDVNCSGINRQGSAQIQVSVNPKFEEF